MQIRSLDPVTDRAYVDAFFQSAADYITLERGEPPGPDVTQEFFTDAPPGCDPARSHRVGLFENTALIALAEMARGYPTATDAYLGLLIVTPTARGTGAGQILLAHIESLARQSGAQTLYLAVLDANPRGRAFWERMGFTDTGKSGKISLGPKTQTAHRLKKPL